MWVFGGKQTRRGHAAHGDLFVYTCSDATPPPHTAPSAAAGAVAGKGWRRVEPVGDVPAPRAYHAAVLRDSDMYVQSGGGKIMSQNYSIYNVASRSAAQSISPASIMSSGCAVPAAVR